MKGDYDAMPIIALGEKGYTKPSHEEESKWSEWFELPCGSKWRYKLYFKK